MKENKIIHLQGLVIDELTTREGLVITHVEGMPNKCIYPAHVHNDLIYIIDVEVMESV